MEQTPVPHVLIFPLPAQGHVNCMLKLAELLALDELHVTFLNTNYNNQRLQKYTDAKTRFARFPRFRFETIKDGITVDSPPNLNSLIEFLSSIKTVVEPDYREMVISGRLESDGWPPVTCIIADGLLTFPIDVAKELGIQSLSFRTASACYLWACFCIPKLIEAGEVPFGEDADMDKLIRNVPGMEDFARRGDLPTFCRAKDINDYTLQLVQKETQNSAQARAQILNTFEDLEGPILTQIRSKFPKVYTIGPLHALLNSRRTESSPCSFSNSLLEVDRSCMTWLDSQPPKSVMYVSFGSVIFMSHTEMLEFWYGLVNSGKRFLWVLRPDILNDKDEGNDIPKELREGTKDKGCMVGWSPQEEVLRHPAIGGFLTHSGWNSTLESLVAGIPMLCWPQVGDQPINCRFISERWKVGLDMKDKCDRSTVERMIRYLMEDRREELMRSIDKMAERARRCVAEGGSSYSNMDQLIRDIKSMSLDAFGPT